MVEPVAVAWFPRAELTKALTVWPNMIEWDFDGYPGYCRNIEGTLRGIAAAGSAELFVAPIVVDELVYWCRDVGADPAEADSRAHYAAVVLARDEAVPWPPAPREPCWCGSGDNYSECCRGLHSV